MITDRDCEPHASPALVVARHLAWIAANGQEVEPPCRTVSWRGRDQIFPDVPERTAALVAQVRAFVAHLREAGSDVHVASEGLCRVMVGGRSGGPGEGERFTGLVLHVVADGEPARSVLLPLE